jgi:hypothetical protein
VWSASAEKSITERYARPLRRNTGRRAGLRAIVESRFAYPPEVALRQGGQMLARIIGWLLVAFVVYYLLTNPGGAAGVVHSLLDGLRHLGNSLSEFADRM